MFWLSATALSSLNAVADTRDFGCLTTNKCMSSSLNIDAIKILLLRFLLCDCHNSQQLGLSQHVLVQRKVFCIGDPDVIARRKKETAKRKELNHLPNLQKKID